MNITTGQLEHMRVYQDEQHRGMIYFFKYHTAGQRGLHLQF